MGKKEQNIMLLQEVVGQLRKLNASSVRDRLRESEEAKRAEAIVLQGEDQVEDQALIVSSQEDFRRRFVAGQAKTVTDQMVTATTRGKSNRIRNNLLHSINRTIGSSWDEEKQEYNTIEKLLDVSTFDAGIAKLHGSLNQIWLVLTGQFDFDKHQFDENTKSLNEQQRLEEERRREAIDLQQLRLTGPGGKGPDGGTLALPDPNAGGGGGGMALGAMVTVVALKAWKWTKGLVVAFRAWGAKLFSKFKLSSKQVKMLANPRKWPLILAGVLAAGFLGAKWFSDDGEGDDALGDDVLPGELDDLPEQSALAKNMDNLFLAAAVGGIMSRSTMIKNVAAKVGTKVNAAYKNAPKTSMRGRLYANAGFKRGLALTGRGLLRFMGPWGFGAWVVWELSSFALKQYRAQEVEAEGALKEFEDIQLEAVDSIYSDPDLASFVTDPSGPMNFKGAAQKAAAKERIRKLMEGKSIEVKNRLKQELMDLGWDSWELTPLMSGVALGSGKTYNHVRTNRFGEEIKLNKIADTLKLEEEKRIKGFGERGPAAGGGVFNSGNVIGDTITNSYLYVTGYQAAAFEGRKGYMPGK